MRKFILFLGLVFIGVGVCAQNSSWPYDEVEPTSTDTLLIWHNDSTKVITMSQFLWANALNPLTANWDAGPFTITGTRFISDIATGTAPFGVSSTTVVTNLNADQLDGQTGSYYTTLANQDATAWRVFYSNGSGDLTEVALGAAGTYFGSNGVTSVPSFSTPSGSGVTIGTDNQIPIVNAGGTDFEYSANFTWDGSDLKIGAAAGDTALTGTDLAAGSLGLAAANNLSDVESAATSRTNLDVDQAGTDNSTDVSLAGTPDYITIVGQVITRNQIVLTTDVSGVLPDANVANDITITNISQVQDITSTAAEINYLDGADTDITTLLLPASTTISAFGATVVDDADAATARTTLGAGTSDISMDGTTANGLVTYGGADNIDVEANATFDGSTLSVSGAISATGNITGTTDVTLHTAATDVLTTAECRNTAHFNNDADAIDFTLPGAAAGLVVIFYDIAGGVITIDPADGTDTIYLNGTSVGAGDAIDSPGAVGDFIALMAIDATRWVTVGRSGTWVDGGAD